MVLIYSMRPVLVYFSNVYLNSVVNSVTLVETISDGHVPTQVSSRVPSLFRRHFELYTLLLRTHRPAQDRQIINIDLGIDLNFQKWRILTGLPPCLVYCVPALLSESICRSLLAPHHPHPALLPQCPPASSIPAKSCSPAAKTGLLTKASQWSSLALDSTAFGSNATEGGPTRTAATLLPNNESASGARVVCWDANSRCWQM